MDEHYMRRVSTVLRHLQPGRADDAAAPSVVPVPAAATTTALPSRARAFDPVAMRELCVDEQFRVSIDKCYAELAKPEYVRDGANLGLSTKEYRLAVHRQFQRFARSGLVSVRDLHANPHRFLAALGAAGQFDFGLAAKIAVHYELFGMTLLELGTKKHHDAYLDKIDALEVSGAFAMTEIGHGSNVQRIGTTATYDVATHEFVLHTPDPSCRKCWIGNAYVGGGNTAVVFAQLLVAGTNHGVHAFVTPLRQADGTITPGVRVFDVGEKIGWRGMDNGSIEFTQVRVPRDALLDRLGQVAADGTYNSSIERKPARFGRMLAALVFGRIIYVAGPVNIMQLCLTIAVRYAYQRRQFGPPGQPEIRLIDWSSHQRKLMPVIAATYAYETAVYSIFEMYRKTGPTAEFNAVVSGLKAFLGEYCLDKLSLMRVACGGHGYGAWSRIGLMRVDYDNFLTAEGDSTVLRQQTANYLLRRFRKDFGKNAFTGTLAVLAAEAGIWLQDRNVIAKNRCDIPHLTDPAFLTRAFAFRLARMMRSSAMRMRSLIRANKSQFDAWNETLPMLLEMVDAYVATTTLESMLALVKRATSLPLRRQLQRMTSLFALTDMTRSMDFYLRTGFVSGRKARAIDTAIGSLCSAMVPHALDLVDAWAIPDHVIGAPLGLSDMSYVKHIAADFDTRQIGDRDYLL